MSQSVSGESPEALEACLRDIISLLAMTSVCRGRTVDAVTDLVAQAIRRVLDVDVAWLRGRDLEAPGALVAAADLDPDGTRRALEGAGAQQPTVALPPLGEVRVCVVGVGFLGGAGRLLVASRRADFPRPLELVVTQAAASIAAGAIENAALLAAAREADRHKDDFLALLGHELRNPLAPIQSALDHLDARGAEKSRELEIIARQTHHLVRLVDDLMDVSRLTRGRLTLELDTFPLGDSLEEAIERAAPLLRAKNVTLTTDVEAELHVLADPHRLAQVFTNLLTNAAKNTAEGGHVHVSAAREGEWIRVRVRDDGRGIAADQREAIFEPFVQAARPEGVLSGGLGLGLALVRNLVGLHGGQVHAESEGEGRGATFVVALPPVAALPRVVADAVRERPPTRARRILVVDDNADALELLSLGLSARGHDVRVADDGPSALEVAREMSPEIAILDVGLPGMDGCTLARHLRAQHGERLRLIALTGYADSRTRDETQRAGFERHLVKPVKLRELAAILQAE